MEAEGIGIQVRGSRGIQEDKKFVPGLGVEEGWMVQCQQELGCGETVAQEGTGEMQAEGGHRKTGD